MGMALAKESLSREGGYEILISGSLLCSFQLKRNMLQSTEIEGGGVSLEIM